MVVTATIISNKKKLDPKYQVISIDISREINRIPDARIVLLDGTPSSQQFEIADSDLFVPGSDIEVKLRYEDKAAEEATVFKGQVIKQTIRADQDGFLLIVELKHKMVGFTSMRKNAVFPSMSDKKIISDILKANLESSSSLGAEYMHKQLVQYNCSDWDFVLSRVDANGCALIVGDETVLIKPIKDLEAGDDGGKKIVFGLDEVYEFELEANASDPVEKVSASSWLIKDQALLAPKTSEAFKPSFGNLDGADISKKITPGEHVLINAAEVEENELQAWANARLMKSRMSLFKGMVTLKGRADVLPGKTIQIEGAGKRYKGKALVSGIRHRVDQEGWVTDLQLGISPSWFSENKNIMENPALGLLPGIHGLQVGIVDKFEEDPEKNFRVKVKIPAFKSSDKDGIVWARLSTLYAGKEYGFFFFPEEGDEVIIGFFNGDPRQAIVLGSVYGNSHGIPKTVKASKENIDKGIVGKNGARISFKDDKKSVIELATPGKSMITIDDTNKSIVLIDENENKIEMNQSGITIKTKKDFILDAGGNVTIKGTKVDVK